MRRLAIIVVCLFGLFTLINAFSGEQPVVSTETVTTEAQ
jgi:hypothetical protein